MTRRSVWWLWGLAAVAAAFLGFWVAAQVDRSAPQLASGTWIPTPRGIGELTLTTQTGQALTRADLTGHPTLVFFGYTHCPDVCPATLAALAQVTKKAAIADLKVLFVS